MSADEQPCDPLAAGEDDDPARWTMETDDAAAGNVETGVSV